MNRHALSFFVKLADLWAKKRQEEAATMCAKRKLTEDEIRRAMVIGKWFFGWNSQTGQCPILSSDAYWHKKLCALFEWIAVLEAEARDVNRKPRDCAAIQALVKPEKEIE